MVSLRSIRRVHAGIATNLNQLTAKLHATGELDRSLPAALDAITGLTGHLEDAVQRVTQLVDGRSR